jgi:hypothetical protein
MPFRHARARLPDCISIIGQIRRDLHVRHHNEIWEAREMFTWTWQGVTSPHLLNAASLCEISKLGAALAIRLRLAASARTRRPSATKDFRSLQVNYEFSRNRAASNEGRRWRNNARFLAEKSTSTNGRTAADGNAQASSRARIVRTSTKEESLAKAKDVAEDWYLQLRGKLRTGELKAEKTFREVSERFLREYDIMTQGQRNKHYVDGKHWRSSVYLVPSFGNMGISKITTGKIVEYRIHRHQQAIAKRAKPPAHSTMHQEIVTLRQTLKTATRHGWLDRLPDFSEPYRLSSKISYRAWFSPEEYEKLCEATRKRPGHPVGYQAHWYPYRDHPSVCGVHAPRSNWRNSAP